MLLKNCRFLVLSAVVRSSDIESGSVDEGCGCGSGALKRDAVRIFA